LPPLSHKIKENIQNTKNERTKNGSMNIPNLPSIFEDIQDPTAKAHKNPFVAGFSRRS
jgi:hypothetical protein